MNESNNEIGGNKEKGAMEERLYIRTRGYRVPRCYDLCFMQTGTHRNHRELSAKLGFTTSTIYRWENELIISKCQTKNH